MYGIVICGRSVSTKYDRRAVKSAGVIQQIKGWAIAV